MKICWTAKEEIERVSASRRRASSFERRRLTLLVDVVDTQLLETVVLEDLESNVKKVKKEKGQLQSSSSGGGDSKPC